jgi:hypothetical protein
VIRTLLVAVAAAGFFASGFVLTPSVAQAQATSFREDFNSNALPATLEESGPSPNYAGGVVTFPNDDRRYLRTNANYNTTDFIAEVTVTVSSGSGGNGIGFFGLGSGDADSGFFSEPRVPPTAYVRIAPDDFGDGFVAITTSSQENIGSISGAAGDGTHRVRITWNQATQSFTVAIQKNYTGGAFSPTSIIGTVVPEAFGATDTRIFFGGAGDSVFDDLLVLSLAGTPGMGNCHGKSVSALARQFRGMAHAALALGFPSADALQNVIQGFCGN